MSKWHLKGIVNIIGKSSGDFTFAEIKIMTDEQLEYYVETIREDMGSDMSYELSSRTSSAYRRIFNQRYKLAEIRLARERASARFFD